MPTHAAEDPVASMVDLGPGIGYVRIIRLAHQSQATDNDRLLMVNESADVPGIPLRESTDDGEHWRSLGTVGDQLHDDPAWQLLYQPDILELPRALDDLPRGALLLAADAVRKDERGHASMQSMQVLSSIDLGRTWRYRGTIVEGGGRAEDRRNRGVWEPCLVVLDDGRLLAFYSSEQHKEEGFNQLLAYRISPDGGRTWGEEKRVVALDGGVERPGMSIVQRLPDGGYVMSYENIDGERNGQVHLKFSRDGLDWGDASDRGMPVQTVDGSWPVASPIVRWLPSSDPAGVLVVAAQRAGGNDEAEGRRLYWNNDGGRGPWWQVPAPVQKRTGNIHAGWTQSLLSRADGKTLHATTSSSSERPGDADANRILQASAALDFHRYEAENAERTRAARIPDRHMSNGARVRLAGTKDARLRFDIKVDAQGAQGLAVRYADLGFAAVPMISVDGTPVPTDATAKVADGWRTARAAIAIEPGLHRIEIHGAPYALDYDWIDVLPAHDAAEQGR